MLVLDDEKGLLIAPVIREGRLDKGMPKLNLTEPQISDIVAWLHVLTYAAGHRGTYAFGNVVTGDPKKGEITSTPRANAARATPSLATWPALAANMNRSHFSPAGSSREVTGARAGLRPLRQVPTLPRLS